MTTDQALRRALPVDRTAATLLDGAGRQWDPAIVDAFLRSIADRLEQSIGRPPMSGAPRAAPPNGLTQTL
jgi:HD-GYP domain-containing protein (c-di-GMP phosphodiesterase class II)